jgi:hypothetical protein
MPLRPIGLLMVMCGVVTACWPGGDSIGETGGQGVVYGHVRYLACGEGADCAGGSRLGRDERPRLHFRADGASSYGIFGISAAGGAFDGMLPEARYTFSAPGWSSTGCRPRLRVDVRSKLRYDVEFRFGARCLARAWESSFDDHAARTLVASWNAPPRKTQASVRLWASFGATPATMTLRCSPPSGTHPHPASACRALLDLARRPFRWSTCIGPAIYPLAEITGVVDGARWHHVNVDSLSLCNVTARVRRDLHAITLIGPS